MVQIVKFVLFLLVNAAGYFTIAVIYNLAVKMDTLPELTVGGHQMLLHWLMGIGTWVWIAAALASVGYFFARGELRAWLILAPLYAPAIYALSVLVYFNFFAPAV